MGSIKFLGKLPNHLASDEQYELLIKASKGDTNARDLLIVHNIKLVTYEVTKKFYNTNCDIEDLVSIGIIGLIKAIDSYEINKNIRLSTYAIRCIDNEILMHLRKSKKKLHEISDNSPMFRDNEAYIYPESLRNYKVKFIDEIEEEDLINKLKGLINELPDRDKMIISLRFGFIDGISYSQKDISSILNITQSYVSRIIKRILRKIEITPNGNIVLRKTKY